MGQNCPGPVLCQGWGSSRAAGGMASCCLGKKFTLKMEGEGRAIAFSGEKAFPCSSWRAGGGDFVVGAALLGQGAQQGWHWF